MEQNCFFRNRFPDLLPDGQAITNAHNIRYMMSLFPVLKGGKSLAKVKNIQILGDKEGQVMLQVGSGEYYCSMPEVLVNY